MIAARTGFVGISAESETKNGMVVLFTRSGRAGAREMPFEFWIDALELEIGRQQHPAARVYSPQDAWPGSSGSRYLSVCWPNCTRECRCPCFESGHFPTMQTWDGRHPWWKAGLCLPKCLPKCMEECCHPWSEAGLYLLREDAVQ